MHLSMSFDIRHKSKPRLRFLPDFFRSFIFFGSLNGENAIIGEHKMTENARKLDGSEGRMPGNFCTNVPLFNRPA